MKKVIGAIALLLLSSLAFPRLAESAEEPNYSSEKPLYARVALTEDGSKVLSVVFDESEGTGKGYDVLYADANFNGRFDESEKLAAKIHRCSPTGMHCNFPAIKLNVRYNRKAIGVPDPCEVTFNYARHSYTTALKAVELSVRLPEGKSAAKTLNPSLSKTTTNEDFYVSSTIRLQGSAQWQYSFRHSIKPSEALENAPVCSFNGTPELMITTKPDPKKKGNLGIGLDLVPAQKCPRPGADNRLECKKGGLPIKAHVEIKKADGTVIHRGDDTLDKFTFG